MMQIAHQYDNMTELSKQLESLQVAFITSLAKEVMSLVALVCLFVYLSVCLSVDITQKFMNRLGWNLWRDPG